VYWRRRAVALLVVLGVPLVLVVLVVQGLSSEPTPEAEAEPKPEASGAPGEVAEPDSDASPSPSPSSSSDPDAEAAAEPEPAPAPAACADENIAVVVSLDQQAYPADADPAVTMTITNASGSDCLRDIGAGANEIVITSGGQHVWSSDDCDPSQDVDEQVLPPGVDAATTVTWERVLSTPGCGGSGAAAQPGTYVVEGRNGSVGSEPVRFVLQ
jgi:hypothetical protein